ncbi:glycosyltransferase [Flindersiella endophytica]
MAHIVTAVVVTHNGERWLGELIAGLRQQRRTPDRVVVVDTGSSDGSRDLIGRAFGPQVILNAPPSTGFGAAVNKAERALPARNQHAVEWLWLLHDDCSPTPAALHHLLELAQNVPTAAVIGPKLRSWPRGRQLLEMGVQITGSGNRETGLEYAEFDQGQHDSIRDVLAVGTAGMLVRRDVFERLKGFDPRIKLFRDDVDFGWRAIRAGFRVITCPESIVFHAEAAARGGRRLHAVRGRVRRVDRTHAMYTLLANCAWWAVPLVWLRMIAGGLFRTIGLLIAKWPDAAYDEFRATLTTFLRPDLILVGRLRRAGRKKVNRRAIRHLFPPPWIGILHTVDQLAGVVSARTGTHSGPARRRRGAAAESGPVSEEAESMDDSSSGVVRWVLTRPSVLLVGALVLITVVASRGLLGSGSLGGGALLPAQESFGELWRAYTSSWPLVELGGGAPMPPYVAVVGALSTLTIGNVGLAVDLLVLGSVPLAGLTAYFFSREIAKARAVRIWAAASYALLPAATGAIAAGRIGTCTAAILLPLLGMAAVRMVRSVRGNAKEASWSSTWATALALAVVTAFVPLAYGFAAVLAIAALVAYAPRGRLAARFAIVLVVPPVLLLPWLTTLLSNPEWVLGEAGRATVGLADSALPPYLFAFADPGGPGGAPWWILIPLAAVALIALLRRDRANGVIAAWAVSLVALAIGLVQSRLLIQTDWLPDSVPAWPGFAAVVIATGWIVAVAHAADGAVQVFSQRSFSWRQPGAGLLLIVCAMTPAFLGGWWLIRGADGPLDSQPGAVPAYMARAMESDTAPRTLVLRQGGEQIRYALLRGDGARLGDAESSSPVSKLRVVDQAVSQVLGEASRERGAQRLATFGVGYIYLPAPADQRLSELLDTTPGLTRSSAPAGAGAWQLELPAGQARIVEEGDRDPAQTTVLEGGQGAIQTSIPASEKSRKLVLAEAADADWTATLDGERLKPIEYDGWAQAFELPSGGGRLVVEHDSPLHLRLVVLQGLLVILVLVLSLPTRARRDTPIEYTEPGGRHGATDPMALPDHTAIRRAGDQVTTRS